MEGRRHSKEGPSRDFKPAGALSLSKQFLPSSVETIAPSGTCPHLHPGAHIDRDGEHGPPNRLAVLFVHNNHIDHSVNDPSDFVRTVGGLGAWAGSDLRENIPFPSPACGLLKIKFLDAALPCPTVRSRQALEVACIVYTLDQCAHGLAILSEPEALDLLSNLLSDPGSVRLESKGVPAGWGSELVARLV